MMYIAYYCNKCKITFIIPTEDIKRMELTGRHMACNYGHKDIVKVKKYDDILECFKQKFSTLI